MDNNSMIILSTTLVSIIAMLFTVYSLIEIISDKRKQKKIVEGLEYRRIHGLFDVDQYINTQNAIKKLSFLKQNNTGPNPDTFDKDLTCIDYCDDKSQLVIKRG